MARTGIDLNVGMDLFREGFIETSKEPAFEVEVRDHDGMPASLPGTMHWRVQVLDEYSRGRWKNCVQAGTFSGRRGQATFPMKSIT